MELFLVAEMGFEPHDLRVMSPASYQTAPLRDILVPEAGVEPVREKISRDFKSRASANSAIPANFRPWFPSRHIIIALMSVIVNPLLKYLRIFLFFSVSRALFCFEFELRYRCECCVFSVFVGSFCGRLDFAPSLAERDYPAFDFGGCFLRKIGFCSLIVRKRLSDFLRL